MYLSFGWLLHVGKHLIYSALNQLDQVAWTLFVQCSEYSRHCLIIDHTPSFLHSLARVCGEPLLQSQPIPVSPQELNVQGGWSKLYYLRTQIVSVMMICM
jgi:hypothetical protein